MHIKDIPLDISFSVPFLIVSSLLLGSIVSIFIYGHEWPRYKTTIEVYLLLFCFTFAASLLYFVACIRALIKEWYARVCEDAVARVKKELKESQHGSINQ